MKKFLVLLLSIMLAFILLVLCCASAEPAEADWRIFENNLCLKDSDAVQNADQVLQRDLYTGTVNGMEFTVTEAGYDGRSLFLRYRYRIPEVKNALGVRAEEIYGQNPPDGLKPDSYETGSLTEEGNELLETRQIGSWWYQFLINGNETGPAVGATQSLSGSDVPGEIFETYYLPLYKNGILLDGVVRISLPVGDALPENDAATFELDTKDILSQVRTSHPEQGTELTGFTAKVKEAAFSPLLTYITVETELKPGATENNDPLDVAAPLLQSLKLVDGNGTVLFAEKGGMEEYEGNKAQFVFPYIENLPESLFLAPIDEKTGEADMSSAIPVI